MEFGKGISFYKQPGRPAKKPDSDEELLKLYENHTATEIAAMYGVKPTTVRSWISDIRKDSPQLSQSFKGRGPQGGRPTVRPSDEELIDLYMSHTATEIGAMYGVSPSTVRSWVSKVRKAVATDAG